jgi:hypothetical protein
MMEIDDFKGVWQARAGDAAPIGENMSSLIARLERLDRDVRRRDLRETLAAFFVMSFFGWRALTTEDPLVRLGAVVVVLGAMFIIFWSRRAVTPSARELFAGDLPIALFCRRELQRVEQQMRLMRSVWWWYVSPTIVGVLIMVLAPAGAIWAKVVTALVVVGVGVAIHWMNIAAAKHQLEPLRDELRARLHELESGT